jgi:hypothetical protein
MVNKEKEIPLKKHSNLGLILISLVVLIILIIFFFFSDLGEEIYGGDLSVCGDSSFYSTCSLVKPYYCDEGILVEKATLCGCEDGQKAGDKCVDDFSTGKKEINLKYVLRGEAGAINFQVYSGVVDYLGNQSKIISYSGNEIISRRDSNLISIDEEVQFRFLIKLVKEIQNLGKTKDDQARIAISLVQNIPFGESNKTVIFVGGEVPYARYPYEVLYEEEGICEEKSNLLAFLLRELGYGVSLFYQQVENHASLGIKCPFEKSYKETGYCFIETTGPSIIGDDNLVYLGGITLFTKPEQSLISEGWSFGEENFYEYEDSKEIAKIYSDIEDKGTANSRDFRKLVERYGLGEIYNL